MNIDDFAYNVSRLRKEAQMSQGDLAEKLNVSISAVSKWENGKNLPSVDTIKAIAAFFDVQMEDLLNPYKEETASTEASDIEVNTSKSSLRVIVIITLLVCCLCVVGFSAAAKFNDTTKQPIVVNSRSVENAAWGTTTELAVYYHEEITDDMAHEYASVIREGWIHEDMYGGKSVSALKIFFYTDRSEAQNFSEKTDFYLMLFANQ